MTDFQTKYLKYKKKYLDLLKYSEQIGGLTPEEKALHQNRHTLAVAEREAHRKELAERATKERATLKREDIRSRQATDLSIKKADLDLEGLSEEEIKKIHSERFYTSQTEKEDTRRRKVREEERRERERIRSIDDARAAAAIRQQEREVIDKRILELEGRSLDVRRRELERKERYFFDAVKEFKRRESELEEEKALQRLEETLRQNTEQTPILKQELETLKTMREGLR